jgi:hypothetical protein
LRRLDRDHKFVISVGAFRIQATTSTTESPTTVGNFGLLVDVLRHRDAADKRDQGARPGRRYDASASR